VRKKHAFYPAGEWENAVIKVIGNAVRTEPFLLAAENREALKECTITITFDSYGVTVNVERPGYIQPPEVKMASTVDLFSIN